MRRVLGAGAGLRYSGQVSGWLQWVGLFAAGGVGVCLRWWLARLVDGAGWGLPHAGTLVVNLVGCLAIGALAAGLAPGPLRTILLVGLLGGLTTYSSFALLSVELAEAGRWAPLAWQLGLHVLGGLGMVVLGAAIVGALRG